ncbi:putative polyketide synthase [Gordonia effusa NBRC 100432]|uniref:Putative polyketide synthase n=1 Tax=Gordonia effusa NBRC 100432 TaxID=1077974 RepID=H0QXQ9_9ACTN|nr:acyltransferase domain-containing protein [Gordonia effusa]GAB17610.1 putative polyketide synthase [Gordonia effusa NBRC 100432]
MSDMTMPNGLVPLLVSSERQDGVALEAAALADYLDIHSEVRAADLAAALMRARPVRRHRALIIAGDRDHTLGALQALATSRPHPDVVVASKPAINRQIGFVFPGQGSQRAGMGAALYEASTVFRARVDDVDRDFQATVGLSPLRYLLDDNAADEVTLVQPAIFLLTLGLYEMWREAGVVPAATIGHSQGEIAAAAVSGLMSVADAIRVVTMRAKEIRKLDVAGLMNHTMGVIGQTRDQVEDLLARCSGWAELAVVNSGHIHAISGEKDAVVEILARAEAAGAFARRIKVDYPGHTSYVNDFREEFGGANAGLTATEFLPGTLPCFGATLGNRITPAEPLNDYWFWNLRNTVRFDLAIINAVRAGVDTFVEMSEHPTMLLSIQENVYAAEVTAPERTVTVGTAKRGTDPLTEFSANLARVIVDDAGYTWPQTGDGLPLPDFPHTRFDTSTYWAPDMVRK